MTLDLPGGVQLPPKLLRMALTHSSYAQEHRRSQNNERLEFLGDAVIDLVYSAYLYDKFPSMPEGELTLLRANAVNTTALAERARALHLGKYLRLGRGEEKSGGRDRESLLADAFEALVGAVFIGCGWEVASQFVISQLAGIDRVVAKDHKTRLQELLQAASHNAPVYAVAEVSGPDHDRRYTVEVSHQDRLLGRGTGRSKKDAEQQAAAAALQSLTSTQHLPSRQ